MTEQNRRGLVLTPDETHKLSLGILRSMQGAEGDSLEALQSLYLKLQQHERDLKGGTRLQVIYERKGHRYLVHVPTTLPKTYIDTVKRSVADRLKVDFEDILTKKSTIQAYPDSHTTFEAWSRKPSKVDINAIDLNALSDSELERLRTLLSR